MRFIGSVLRIYSYLFEAILCLLGIALSVLILISPALTVNLGWLPWSGAELPRWLLGLGILGLFSVLLAATGKFRLLHFFFAAAALAILVKGLFLGPVGYKGQDEFLRAVYLVIAAFIAVVGSIPLGGGARRQRA